MRLALLLAIAACTPPRLPASPAPVRSAFGCKGPPADPAPIDPTPPRLEVRKLRDSGDGAHVELLAEAATASQLAARLGQALGTPVLMADGLGAYRFTFYLPDVTLSEVDTTLAASMGVRILRRDDMLVLQPPGGGTKFAADLTPVEFKLVTPKGSQTTEQLAALFCSEFASPVGGAQVMGDGVILMDRQPNLARFAALADLSAR